MDDSTRARRRYAANEREFRAESEARHLRTLATALDFDSLPDQAGRPDRIGAFTIRLSVNRHNVTMQRLIGRRLGLPARAVRIATRDILCELIISTLVEDERRRRNDIETDQRRAAQALLSIADALNTLSVEGTATIADTAALIVAEPGLTNDLVPASCVLHRAANSVRLARIAATPVQARQDGDGS